MRGAQPDADPAALIEIADFRPPDARSRFEVWKQSVDGVVSIGDDWRIDTGRALGGDFIRVRAPRHAATIIWAHTEAQLRTALAEARVVDTARALVEEFLDHNELGLAFDTLVDTLVDALAGGDTTTPVRRALNTAATLIGQETPARPRAED